MENGTTLIYFSSPPPTTTTVSGEIETSLVLSVTGGSPMFLSPKGTGPPFDLRRDITFLADYVERKRKRGGEQTGDAEAGGSQASNGSQTELTASVQFYLVFLLLFYWKIIILSEDNYSVIDKQEGYTLFFIRKFSVGQ